MIIIFVKGWLGLALGHGAGAGVLFAVYAFIAAGLEAARAFSSAKAGPVIVHLLLALVYLAAGVVALAWPGRAAVSMLMAKNRR